MTPPPRSFKLRAMEWLADIAPRGLFGWHPAVGWAVVGAALIILEVVVPAAVPAFVIGPFGVAALFAALAGLLGASGGIQLALFIAGGLVLVVPARRFLARRARTLGTGAAGQGGQAATPVGKLGACVEAIGAGGAGAVIVDGVRWDAVAGAGASIEKGATIEVVSVDGTQLVVRARTAEAKGT